MSAQVSFGSQPQKRPHEYEAHTPPEQRAHREEQRADLQRAVEEEREAS